MEQDEQDNEISNIWIKTFVTFPTYDKPGHSHKNRLSFALDGQTLIVEDQKQKKELTAMHPQNDMLILPTPWLQARGHLVSNQHLCTVMLRAAGGQIMKTRAPKGNLVRKLR